MKDFLESSYYRWIFAALFTLAILQISGCGGNASALVRNGPNPNALISSQAFKTRAMLILPTTSADYWYQGAATTKFLSGCPHSADLGPSVIQHSLSALRSVFEEVVPIPQSLLRIDSKGTLVLVSLKKFHWSGYGFGEPIRAVAEIEIRIFGQDGEIASGSAEYEEVSDSVVAGNIIFGGNGCSAQGPIIAEAASKAVKSSVRSALVKILEGSSIERYLRKTPSSVKPLNSRNLISDPTYIHYFSGNVVPNFVSTSGSQNYYSQQVEMANAMALGVAEQRIGNNISSAELILRNTRTFIRMKNAQDPKSSISTDALDKAISAQEHIDELRILGQKNSDVLAEAQKKNDEGTRRYSTAEDRLKGSIGTRPHICNIGEFQGWYHKACRTYGGSPYGDEKHLECRDIAPRYKGRMGFCHLPDGGCWTCGTN